MRKRRPPKPKPVEVPPVLEGLTFAEMRDRAIRLRQEKATKLAREQERLLQERNTRLRLGHCSAKPILQKNPNESDSLKGVSYAPTQEED